MKIKYQLSIVLIAVSFILVTLVSIVFYYNIKKIILDQVYMHLETISENKKIRLIDLINKKYERGEILAGNLFLVKNLTNYSTNPSESYKKGMLLPLLRMKRSIRSIHDIHIVDLKGKIIVSTNDTLTGKDYNNTFLFQSALDRKKNMNDFILIDRELFVSISTPIFHEKQIIGVMIAIISAADITELITSNIGLGQTGETFLGKASEDSAVFFTPLRFDRNAVLKKKVALKDTSICMNVAISKKEGIFFDKVDYRGKEVIASLRFIPQTGWGMVTKIDKKEAFLPLQTIKHLLFMIAIGAVLVALILSYYLSKLLAGPIEKLTSSMTKIREDALSEELDIKSKNEIGTLAKTFKELIYRLQTNMRELKQSNDALEKFAYVISHDLKSPLSTLEGINSLLKIECNGKVNANAMQLIDLQLVKTKELGDLIGGVLESAKKGAKKTRKEEINVNQIIRKVIKNIDPSSSIQIVIQYGCPNVYYYKIPLMQVFQNIIGNAVKYMDKSDGLIEIKCDDLPAYYKFSIRDNGPGIKEEDLNKIFKFFETSNNSLPSSGIGLSIVKKIIEENGGEVSVESKQGVGTVFYFTIPKV